MIVRSLVLVTLSFLAALALAASVRGAERRRPAVPPASCAGPYAPGTYAPVLASSTVATTVVPVLVPTVAVTFQYLPNLAGPDPGSAAGAPYASVGGSSGASAPPPPVETYAAQSFFAAESVPGLRSAESAGRPAVAVRAPAGGIFEAKCLRCHGREARGGVALWNAQGQWQPTQHGAPLSRVKIWEVTVKQRTMPLGGTLSDLEREEITRRLMDL